MRRRRTLASASVLAACACGSAATADTLHVPRDFSTIQTAINGSMDGDVILVAPGVYREAINVTEHIELRSTGGAAVTTIDAAGLNATVVQCGSANGPVQVIAGFTITGGVADTPFFGGGGMHIGGEALILNCRFLANRALGAFPGGLGGGLTAYGFATVINCEFVGNHADDDGGAVAVVEGIIKLVNCTIVSNDAFGVGGATAWDAEIYLYNSIVRGNSPAADQIGCCVTYPFHSNIEGGPSSDGNFDADALFVREPDPGPDKSWGTSDDDPGDLRLRPGSPCIDAGNNDLVPKGVALDLAGNPRFVDDPFTIDTGVGTPPIVDIGANEFQPIAGDATGDGLVDIDDLLAVINFWGPCASLAPPGAPCPADLNGDTVVDVDDLLLVINNWST